MIPQSLRTMVLYVNTRGTSGNCEDKEYIENWWPRVDAYAERMCRSCSGCRVVWQYSPPEPMQRSEPPNGLWEDLSADVMGPMPSGESFLVVVNYYSRYYEVEIMRSTTASKIIAALTEIFARFGYSYSLKTDNAVCVK